MLFTARHEIPYRSAAAVLLPTTASCTTRSSNARLNAESCRAHATTATVGPQPAQSTLRAGPTSSTVA